MNARGIVRFLGVVSLCIIIVSGTAFALPNPIEIASTTGNTLFTTSPTVTLHLSYDATQMQLLTNNATWSAWGAFSASKTVLLPAGDGVKSVSVRFKDADGNVSEIYSDTIILDTKAPVGSVAIEGGAAATDTLAVTLSLAAADANGVSQMRFSTDDGLHWTNPEPFAATAICTLSGALVTKKVLAQFQDFAGKWSASAFDTILYVTTLPTFTPGAVTIKNSAGGTEFTTTAGVKLTVVSPDPGYTQMSLSKNGTTWGGWIAIPATSDTLVSYTLPGGDGVKTVYAQFRAGTSGAPSDAYGDTIILDTKPPTGAVVINGGAYSASDPTVTLTLAAADLNGVSFMQFSATSLGLNTAPWESYATSKDFTLSGGDGIKTVYVRFKDAAGKLSAICTETIVLDSTKPLGTVKINAGAATTTDPTLTLALTATGATEMNVSLDGGTTWGGWEPFATSRKVTLPEGAGTKTVSVMFRDFTGNESQVYSDTIKLNTLQGTYRIISRESSFWKSTSGGVTDNIWSTRAVATFNGLDGCSISFSATGYDKMGPDGSGNEYVVAHLESGSATACSYTFTDNDPSTGEFTITMTTPEGPDQITGYVSADGNSVVLGGAKERVYPDGTGYDVDEMVGVRVGTGMTKGSLNGIYNLVNQEASFWKSGSDVYDDIFGNLFTADFDGAGGCSISFTGEGYERIGNSVVVWPADPQPFSCKYTVTTAGAFTVTLTNPDGTESHNGWASADGNVLIMGGGAQVMGGVGTGYMTELVAGVKAGAGMDISSISGTYHLTGSEISFWLSNGYVSDSIWGSQVDVTFDGAGACTVTDSSKGYHVETDLNDNQTVVIDSDGPQTITDCAYTVDPDGKFTVTLTTPDGVESHSGRVSDDGNSVVMGGPRQQTDTGGASYSAELVFGVKVKAQ